MEIRITKTPPAPSMDGFDLRGLRVGGVYIVEDRLGRYLIRAQYAEEVARLAPNVGPKNEPA
jgi:hypothetical protein